MDHDWLDAPIGIDSDRWVSRTCSRTLLVVVHSLVSCLRLLDALDVMESDERIQVIFTIAPDVFNSGVAGHLRELGALVLSWAQATRETFDLALAAAYGGLHQIHAPLIVMAHGAGYGKTVRPPASGGPLLENPVVYGLDAQRLVRDGRVVPSAIILAHRAERDILRAQCPDALPAAVVAGDITFDRLVASIAHRQDYRRSLDVGDQQTLVVVSSTWGPDGVFGGVPDLLPGLMDQLPADRFRVAALLHPAVWEAHGRRQILAWTGDCRAAGLILPGPTTDWRALVVAADQLVGDHGSVTAYAASVGVPVLLLGGHGRTPAPHSAQELIANEAVRLDLDRPLAAQLRAARPLDAGRVAGLLTSRPGRAGADLRRLAYRLLRLRAPAQHRRIAPVPVPGVAGAAPWS
jgi:hypothetical protein